MFGFNYKDQVNYRDVSNLGWNSSGIGSNFILIPGATPVLIEGTFAYSSYLMHLKEALNNPRTSGINGFNLGLNFTWFQGENELQYGLEVLGYQTDYDFQNALGIHMHEQENTSEFSGFIRYKLKEEKYIIEPGLRLYKYNAESPSLEPRLGAKYLATDNLRFKLAAGKYSQKLT